MKPTLITIGVLLACSFVGCGNPTTCQVTGKVTLASQARERIVVYMRPVSGKGDRFSLAVGSTDKDGELHIDTSAGGLKPGEYRVTFSYRAAAGNSSSSSDKKDDRTETVEEKELVPPPYDDATSRTESPVRFSVSAGGENHFVFDIPIGD